MKKAIQSLSLLLFAALLFGCSVPGPQQEGKGAADFPPLTAIPTKEEWAERLQNAEEEEKKELQSQLQSLLWEMTEEELFQVLEGSLEDWAESQQLLDVERISLELTADPLLMDEQTGQRMYANRTAQVDLVFAGEKEAAAQGDLPSQIQQQLVQAVHNTLEGTFSLHNPFLLLPQQRRRTGTVQRQCRAVEERQPHPPLPPSERRSHAGSSFPLGPAMEPAGVQRGAVQSPRQCDAAPLRPSPQRE